MLASAVGLVVGAAPASAATVIRAYVVGTDGLEVIDTATNAVVTTIAVGTYPSAVAANPSGTRIYVTNFGSNDVSVVDTATNTVVATVAVGLAPRGVVVNPAGTRVYVTNSGYGSDNVSVIDATTNTVVKTIALGPPLPRPLPYGIAVNPAGTRVYVVDAGPGPTGVGRVQVIDTSTKTVTTTLAVGDYYSSALTDVAVSPDGTRLYLGCR